MLETAIDLSQKQLSRSSLTTLQDYLRNSSYLQAAKLSVFMADNGSRPQKKYYRQKTGGGQSIYTLKVT
jgi:hypothetical protein